MGMRWGPWSGEVRSDGFVPTLPSPVQNLTAVEADGTVVLTWEAPRILGAAFIGYSITRREEGGPAIAGIHGNDPLTVATFTDSNVRGVRYTYRVDATNTGGTSSAEVSFELDLLPMFEGNPRTSPRSFRVNQAVNLTLPQAGGGNPPLFYALDPVPPGLSLDGRVLSGTPTVATSGEVTYTATDSDGDVAELRFNITVTDDPPVASALFSPGSVPEGGRVTLDGTESNDPEGLPLTYRWAQASGGPRVMLENASSATPSFMAPDDLNANIDLTFTLTVMDPGGNESNVATVIVTVLAINEAPVANAGLNQTVFGGVTVTLDGSNSNDPDGDALSYLWTYLGASSMVNLLDRATATPTFTVPLVGEETEFEFSLMVTDPSLRTAVDTVAITTLPNKVPSAEAGQTQNVVEGVTVTLDGSGSSDPEGYPLTYLWEQIGGTPTVMLSDPTAESPTFTAPVQLQRGALLTFRLTVTDPVALTGADTTVITVTAGRNAPPDVNAGEDRGALAGSTITLMGSVSDPEGDNVTYLWRRIEGGIGSALLNVTSPIATVNLPTLASGLISAGDRVKFELRAIDARGGVATDEVVFTIFAESNEPPTADAGPDQTVDDNAEVTLDGRQQRSAKPTAQLFVDAGQRRGRARADGDFERCDCRKPHLHRPGLVGCRRHIEIQVGGHQPEPVVLPAGLRGGNGDRQ